MATIASQWPPPPLQLLAQPGGVLVQYYEPRGTSRCQFTSPRQFRDAIDAIVEVYNPKASPFEWTKAIVHQSKAPTDLLLFMQVDTQIRRVQKGCLTGLPGNRCDVVNSQDVLGHRPVTTSLGSLAETAASGQPYFGEDRSVLHTGAWL